jgi:predicted DCC family thiol-disulfide oxidoreductase YuxK
MNDSPIILFDGLCGLCSRGVRIILRHDGTSRFRFASLQSEAGKRLVRKYGIDESALSSLVLIEDGRAFLRSEAGLRIVRRLDGAVRFLWILRFVPRFLRDAMYRLVARYRYRAFGRHASCWTPPGDVKDRFLES